MKLEPTPRRKGGFSTVKIASLHDCFCVHIDKRFEKVSLDCGGRRCGGDKRARLAEMKQ